MKPPLFEYHDPRALAEACELLGTLDNAKVLAGGQSLLPMLNMRIVFPDHLVDINNVAELAFIRESGNRIAIGAMTRQRDLERNLFLVQRCPLITQALEQIGHRQTRNRGTLGGSLCHLDPAAELPAVMMALDATLRVHSVRGERTIAMADFPAFYMTPAMEADEILGSIEFEPWPQGHGSAFMEYARRHGDFAVVASAVLLDVAADGTVRRAAVCLGGVGTGPLRCPDVESAVVGTRGGDAVFQAATSSCLEIDAMEDVHASQSYRRHLAQALTARALRAAYAEASAAGEQRP